MTFSFRNFCVAKENFEQKQNHLKTFFDEWQKLEWSSKITLNEIVI